MSNPNGGSALPIVVLSGVPTIAYRAYPAVLLDASSIGSRPLSAGPAQPVVYLNASDLDYNGGAYHLEANSAPMPVYVVTDGRAITSTPAIAVYLVGGVIPPVIGSRLQLEDSSFILLQDGSFLLLEA